MRANQIGKWFSNARYNPLNVHTCSSDIYNAHSGPHILQLNGQILCDIFITP